MNPNDLDRYRGCLLGLAVGDAVGTTVEFQSRGTFLPLVDMVGGGPFGLKPGQWTDDTSMALCLATSLVEKKGFDPADQMERYLRWYDHGYLSSNGRCFDIGTLTREALERFRTSRDPFSGSKKTFSAGNGSLMRLAPAALFYAPDQSLAAFYAGESSRTTHAASECIDACKLFAAMLVTALKSRDKMAILFSNNTDDITSTKIIDIANGAYQEKHEDQIDGSGYVVQSLEAALWCFWKTNSFSEAVLMAANLGNDADTTAAICGQIAGAFYGQAGIPTGWLDKLTMRAEITSLADQLASH
jgi:ADP-ribosyl-[dinitrogen reductase] hydrolase